MNLEEEIKGLETGPDPYIYPDMEGLFGKERAEELNDIKPDELAAIIAESSLIVLNQARDFIYANYGLLFQFGLSSDPNPIKAEEVTDD